jgi:outer membrane biosynthesis protein TonB
MKKYQAGGGIREGRARFGDDVRERARQEMARRAAGVETMPVKPPADTRARPINQAASKPKPKPKPRPAPKPEPKPEPKAETPKVEETPKIEGAAKKEEPKRKWYQFGPRKTFATRESMGRAKGGAVKKMAKGGSVSKRADGCAMKGKTKGRMI